MPRDNRRTTNQSSAGALPRIEVVDPLLKELVLVHVDATDDTDFDIVPPSELLAALAA